MERFAFATKDARNCVSALDPLSEQDAGSALVSDSFSRFPNGFLINDSIDAGSFLSETIKQPARKDRLSRLLASVAFVKRLGTSSCDIAIPSSILEDGETILAMKMTNESLVLWTDSFVYKIPASAKATKRLKKTKDSVSIIMDCSAELQNCFLIPKIMEQNGLIWQRSTKCDAVSFDDNRMPEIDLFLHRYFAKVLEVAVLQDGFPRGLQHGDLHFRNLLKDRDNRLYLTDLDLVQQRGYPVLDLMHFAIHLVRTIEHTTQYGPLEALLEDKNYLYDKLVAYRCAKLAELWLQHYHEAYIPLYMQSQIEWYEHNNVVADELVQLERLRQRVDL
jgi:hypothetical protein